MSNAEVARQLAEIADLLDLLGERFKPEAYRRAARSIEGLPESLERFAARGELRAVPGVGEAIAEKVSEILRTGHLAYLDRLRAEIPPGVLDLMRLPGVGPKTARRFWVEIGVRSPAELRSAIEAGRLVGVRGFAEKKIAQLRVAVGSDRPLSAAARLPIEEVWPVARSLEAALRAAPSVHEVALAGSFRRGRETVGDLDVLVTADSPELVFDAFSRLPPVREVRLRGPTKETVVLDRGLQVDLRVVEPDAFGAALQYFTGSKDHNVRLRSLARDRGLKINEYGVYRDEQRVGGRTEAEVYGALGLAWIPPELREDRGEIAAAASGPLPRLVEPSDLVAEPHAHLPVTPTVADLEQMAARASSRGIRSVGLVVAVVGPEGISWRAPAEVVEHIGGPFDGVRFFPVLEVEGAEAEARPSPLDGLEAPWRVAIPDPRLERPTQLSSEIRLVAHVGGPTESVRPWLELAKGVGAAVEVGPGPDRLDSAGARAALEAGLLLSVASGATEPVERPTGPVALGFARRAGATAKQVLNSREPFDRPSAAPRPAGTPGRRPARRRR